KLIKTLEVHSDYVVSVSFSPNGKYLASGSEDGTIKIWEVESWKLIKTLTGHSNSVLSVSFSPDGKFLASGSYDKTIKIWEVGTWKETKTLKGHSNSVFSISFSPDGKYLASGSWDRTIKIWEVGSWKEITTLTGHSGSVYSVSFSPDGKFLASGSSDKTIKIWEVGTWKEIKTLKGHSDSVYSVSFSPDGKFLASGSRDKTIKIWEVESWKEMETLKGHSDSVNSVSFSPDGKFLASGSAETVKIWDLNEFNSETQEFLKFVRISDFPGYDGSINNELSDYLKKNNYNIIIWMLGVSKGLSKFDAEFLEIVKERAKREEIYILFILNKIDLFEGEEKNQIQERIDYIKQKVEQIYTKNRILGYVPASAKKFKNDEKLVKFLRNVIIIASYVSTFKTNLNIIRDELIEVFEENMTKVRKWDKDYINFYLENLKKGLHKISNFDIITKGESVIKKLISNLNEKLNNKISADIDGISEFFHKEMIIKAKMLINNISIIKIFDLDSNFKQKKPNLKFDYRLDTNYPNLFIQVLLGIIGSIVLGILVKYIFAKPIYGIVVSSILLILLFIYANKKANEIRNKVYNEISSNLPSIITSGWKDVCREIEENYIKQINSITKNQEIDNFLNELISGVYKMNDELSKFIIEKFI
ncbi:MAG: hypothetical protein ABIL76_01725, partial [candidate division WOR-3 bacterium]